MARQEGYSSRRGSPPINRGDRSAAARGGSLQKLIAMEWEVIDEVWGLAKAAGYDKHRGLYYQSLASHARTLMQLLKMAGATGEEGDDLARLLQKMTKKVRKFLRDDKAWRRRLRG
jgi:hypothetical protein